MLYLNYSDSSDLESSRITTDHSVTPTPYNLDNWTLEDHKTSLMIIRGVIFFIGTVLGILGNTVCILVLRKRMLNLTATIFMGSLAMSDVLFLVAFSPTALKVFDTVVILTSFRTFYAYYVSYVYPFFLIFHTTSVWITVCFATSRLIQVTNSNLSKTICSGFRPLYCVIIILCLSVGFLGASFCRRKPVKVVDNSTEDVYYSYTATHLGRDKTFVTTLFWIYFVATKLIPFPLLAGLNFCIIRFVWKARRRRMSGKNVNRSSALTRSRETNMTCILIAVVFGFLACNATSAVCSVYIAVYGIEIVYTAKTPFIYYLFGVGETLMNYNPLVNSVLYTTCSQTMRSEVVSLLSWLPVNRHRAYSGSSADVTSIQMNGGVASSSPGRSGFPCSSQLSPTHNTGTLTHR